ncbi:hypothetical protein KEM60_02055 [Austwickia sp. TVS 96-490-7B]|uniref:glycosyltransferase 87 family protein n=1 Tax=Austwickia sp. TVS 96-490-7B TaxID=2830843 RepID=UPI001C594FB1|nr:glycosyltransferase 87 family protein [Austwickia sp. TVS 96-490-7B]MBW3085844.1 hypothetical protein [Austwickia sp. TVS 96-490-7B]
MNALPEPARTSTFRGWADRVMSAIAVLASAGSGRVGMVLGALTSLAVIGWFTVRGMPTDLEVYRRGVQAGLSGADQIYLTRDGDLPFTYPPLAVLLFIPVGVTPDLVATVMMLVLSLAALLRITVLVLRRLLPGSVSASLVLSLAALTLPLACAYEPIWATFSFGQVNLLLAWVVTEDLLGLQSPRQRRWRGVLTGVATCFKLTPGIYALIFLTRRDWASFGRMVASFLVCVGVGFLAFPSSSWAYWTKTFFDAKRVGGVAYAGNQSLNAAIWRWTGPGGAPLVWVILSLLILAATVGMLVVLGRRAEDLSALLVTSMCGLLISPVSWSHHWVWIWPVCLWISAQLYRRSVSGWTHLSWGWAVVLVAWLVAGYGRIIWIFPNTHDQEYAVSAIGKLITDGYVLAGLVTVVIAAGSVLVTQLRHPATS